MKVRDLKKDQYFTLKLIDHPLECQVWVLDSYCRSEKKWLAYRFSDICDSRLFSPDREIFTDFIF